ncbi:putative membrane protein [Leptospira fainei serovar Hurstbridge str. BUT 6]|uniref:Membrane protein n=1 Tax=Leptospira fainei serovar Hurstbridge str. BUT 6 TaxID=1193011 RepID=S3V364_9LEPT|nr:hypothetical protein [Leptospira fainei]EPG75059.1 putative membrane protein [Leptospira fainei serovar Hurstbridge str. BUT 6]
MRNTLFFVFPILSVFLFILSLGTISTNSRLADSFYNADSLFFPILYSEVFLRDGILGLYGFTDWCWTPSPYFFPDAFFYFVLRTVFLLREVGAWEYTHLCYAFVQWTYLLLGILFLIRTLGIERKNRNADSLFLGIGYLLGALCILEQSRIFLFLPGYHTGAWASLGWTWSFYYLWKRSQKRIYFLACLLSAFALGLSDLFFLPAFLIPLIFAEGIAILFIKETWRARIRSFGKCLIPILLAMIAVKLAYGLLDKNKVILFPGLYASGRIAWKTVFGNPALWWNGFYGASVSVFIANRFELIALVSTSALYILIQKKSRAQISAVNRILPIILFSSLGMIVPLFLVFIPAINGHATQGSPPIDRYFGEMILAALGSFAGLLGVSSNIKLYSRISSFLSSILMVFVLYTVLPREKGVVYYPESIACIDREIQAKDWRRGLASFWESRPLRIFSRNKIAVDDYLEDMSLFYWQNSFRWFLSDRPYSFAIMNGIKKESFETHFGPASAVIHCGDWNVYEVGDPTGTKSAALNSLNRRKIDLWKASVGKK